MKELKITLENVFGIGEFNHSFDVSDDNVIMIYAPNGTMKTSLARTFLSLEEKHNPEDMIINYRKTTCSITINGDEILPEQIYVYKNKEIQIGREPSSITDENIIPIISSPEKYNQFQELLKPLNMHLQEVNEVFLKYVKDKRYDFSEELLKAYKKDGVLDIHEAICELYDDCKTKKIIIPNTIRYGDFFHITSIKYIQDNKSLLKKKNRKGQPIGVNNENRWKKIIDGVDNCESIRSNIEDVESLRKLFLCNFAKKEINVIENYVNIYRKVRCKLIDIVNDINKDEPIWENVISTFNNRFNVPYKIKILNKSEVVLKHSSFIELCLDYDDGIEKGHYLSEDHFLNFISSGERRAYYLLLNLFGIEKRKTISGDGNVSVLVFDDIVESFDYKNKYAFVEYLADLREQKNFIILLLTHNFDFFRTVHSRLDVNKVFIAEKDSRRKVSLYKASYLHDIIKNLFIKNCNNPKYLISLVPVVRNIVEYTRGVESDDYRKLTSFIHVKINTNSLSIKDLFSLISSNIHFDKEIVYEDENYINKLMTEAEYIYKSEDEVALENKLILSIAIRILAEQYMIRELVCDTFLLNCSKNQTFQLFNKYSEMFNDNHDKINILRKVIMMTSENIHLNNFMFEPIIDLSARYLKDLYNRVKSL